MNEKDEINLIVYKSMKDLGDLLDYYKVRSKENNKEWGSQIVRIKPGLEIGLCFNNMIYKGKSENYNQIVNKYLDNIELIRDKNNNIENIKYKIKDKYLNNKDIEVRPEKAREIFFTLVNQRKMMFKSIIMISVIDFEDFISDLYRYSVVKNPEGFILDKTITFKDIKKDFNSIDDLKNKMIVDEVDEFMRGSLDYWFKVFKDKMKIKFIFKDEDFEIFREVYLARNIIVHNKSIVNQQYLSSLKSDSDYKLGDSLKIDECYVLKSIRTIEKLIIDISLSFDKNNNDPSYLREYLFNYGFDLMKNEEWDVSKHIFEFLMKDKNVDEQCALLSKFNYWISLKNSSGLNENINDIEKLDTSIYEDIYKLAKYLILDNYLDANDLIIKLLKNKELNVMMIEDWPLFKQYRESGEYNKIKLKYSELFKTGNYTKEENKENDIDSENLNIVDMS